MDKSEKPKGKLKKMLAFMKRRTEDRLQSRRCDKTASQVNRNFEESIKVLLLGTGESGKTTLLKQIRLLHIDKDFSEKQRKERIEEIRYNLHESIYELVLQVPQLGLDFDTETSREKAKKILALGRDIKSGFPAEYCDWVQDLWQDCGVRQCLSRSNEFQIIDNAKYFLDRVQTIMNPNYIPTNDDIMRSRKITTGITEVSFKVKIPSSMGGGTHIFRLFDVGGQRHHRNKWLQVFEGIQAVLFVISCGEFDQSLREDPRVNRLAESISLFRRVWHNRFLLQSGIITFLNKQDVLLDKINNGKRIARYFPEFEQFRMSQQHGNVFDEFQRTQCFIRQKLADITAETPKRISNSKVVIVERPKRDVFFHFTIATDTDNVRTVFQDVHDMILKKNLQDLGLL